MVLQFNIQIHKQWHGMLAIRYVILSHLETQVTCHNQNGHSQSPVKLERQDLYQPQFEQAIKTRTQSQ